MKIVKSIVPTQQELLSSNLAKLENSLMTIATENNLKDYEKILQDMYQKGFEPHLLAACLLKKVLDDKGISLKIKEVERPTREKSSKTKEFSNNTGERKNKDFRDGGPKVRLHLGLGKKDKIKPGDIVGAITGECKISGNEIGVIDMFDHFCYFEISENHVSKVIKNMKRNTIKGKKAILTIARN